ncbi:MAG: DUF4230 domain-containing protein [Candidatus Melainabacteria bacterium]|nr:DUF4230 domain-containing protein [Candidatus Melainabacteria bacterium]
MKFLLKLQLLPLLVLLLLLGGTAAGSAYYLRFGELPFGLFKIESKQVIERDPTVVLDKLKEEFRLITASRSAETMLSGFTQASVPFSRDEIFYWAFFKAQAVIDLSKLGADSFTLVGDTVYIVLPEPVIEVSIDLDKSKVVDRNSQIFSGPFQDNNLTTNIQRQARDIILERLKKEGTLRQFALESAREKLSAFLGQLGLKVVYGRYQPPAPVPDGNASPGPSLSPLPPPAQPR